MSNISVDFSTPCIIKCCSFRSTNVICCAKAILPFKVHIMHQRLMISLKAWLNKYLMRIVFQFSSLHLCTYHYIVLSIMFTGNYEMNINNFKKACLKYNYNVSIDLSGKYILAELFLFKKMCNLILTENFCNNLFRFSLYQSNKII